MVCLHLGLWGGDGARRERFGGRRWAREGGPEGSLGLGGRREEGWDGVVMGGESWG